MNKRIIKKKFRQAVIQLVTAHREQEQKRQAAIQRAADAYLAYYEQQRAQRGY